MTPETFTHLQGEIGDKTTPPGGACNVVRRLTDAKLESDRTADLADCTSLALLAVLGAIKLHTVVLNAGIQLEQALVY